MDPCVDISFALTGSTIPADHGYALLSAVSHVLPVVHSNPAVGIHPVRGRLVGGRLMALGRNSRLTFRAPASLFASLLPLAGKTLELDGHSATVGVPSAYPLRPAASLRCRLAIIKGFMDPEGFQAAAQRQLDAVGVRGALRLGTRRTMRIKDKEIVGYAAAVTELTAEESVALQEQGLGGRRRMGCGMFCPIVRT